MAAFNDATCKCGKRIGWTGELKDRPPCPRCGYRIPLAELEAVQLEMDKWEQELLARHESDEKSQ